MPYNNSPEVSPIDEVRLLIGDNDENNEFLSDEEISYYIVKRGEGLPAAIGAAYALQAKFSKLADETAGDVEVKWSQRARTALALAESLSRQLAGSDGSYLPVGVFAGGISVSDMETRNSNTDRVQGKFSIGMMGS
jgi:hypothetical protein